MQFVYNPEGADPRSWDFQPHKLMSPEVEVIERHTKMTYAEWVDACGRGSFLALHGLLYVLLKRTIPTLRWDDVQFSMEDLSWELSHDEKVDLVAEMEKADAAGELDRVGQEQLAELKAEVEAADDGPTSTDEGEVETPLGG